MSIEGLEHDSDEIERKFAKLVASILRSLITRNISKESLVACLMGFSCRRPVFGNTKKSRFRKQRRKFEDPSATVSTVWTIIGPFFSFFDYDVLEMITDTLGTDQDKQEFAEYKEHFKSYARGRLFTLQSISSENHPSTSTSKGNTSMIVLLDSSYDNCEIRHLKRLQTNISEVLNMNKGVLQLRKGKKGSVQRMFEIPNFITNDIFPLSPNQESALGELGVTQLDCGDYHFRAKLKVRLLYVKSTLLLAFVMCRKILLEIMSRMTMLVRFQSYKLFMPLSHFFISRRSSF